MRGAFAASVALTLGWCSVQVWGPIKQRHRVRHGLRVPRSGGWLVDRETKRRELGFKAAFGRASIAVRRSPAEPRADLTQPAAAIHEAAIRHGMAVEIPSLPS